MLDLWNHGIGIIDIERRRMLNPSELFTFNPQNCLVELDRTIPFLDFVLTENDNPIEVFVLMILRVIF